MENDNTIKEPSNLSIILDPLILIVKAVYHLPWTRSASWLARLISLPLKLVLVPLGVLTRILLALLSPVVQILSAVRSCLSLAGRIISSLEPLYTFFGTAAAVGLVAGILLATFSTVITSSLGMQSLERPSSQRRKESTKHIRDTSSGYEDGHHYGGSETHYDDEDELYISSSSSRHAVTGTPWRDYFHSKRLPTSSAYQVEMSTAAAAADWQWLDSTAATTASVSSPGARRKHASGLLSQTIHEEEDDSDEDL